METMDIRQNVARMVVFAHVVEMRSFSLAAAALGISKSAVSKQVSELERRLGVRLLNRTTRKLSLTEFGASYFESCERVVQEANHADERIAGRGAEPSGTLRVNAPTTYGSQRIVPLLAELLARYPNLKVDLTVSYTLGDAAITFSRAGKRYRVPINGRLRTNSGDACAQAAMAGHGIAFLPEFYIVNALASGALRPLMRSYSIAPLHAYAVYSTGRGREPKIRAFIDLLVARLGPPT